MLLALLYHTPCYLHCCTTRHVTCTVVPYAMLLALLYHTPCYLHCCTTRHVTCTVVPYTMLLALLYHTPCYLQYVANFKCSTSNIRCVRRTVTGALYDLQNGRSSPEVMMFYYPEKQMHYIYIYIYIYIYKQNFIYRRHSYMFRRTRKIFREPFPSTLLKLQKSSGLQTE